MGKAADVIVVGLGAMGTAACRSLAQAGLKVLGLDQFEPAHDRGSSHGRTRVIRKAYFEDPRYVPMARHAFELWSGLASESGERLLQKSGCLNLGPPDHPAIRGVRQSVAQHDLFHEVLTGCEVRKRWPSFHCDDCDLGIYEADAGFLFPERCIAAQADGARSAGANLRYNQRIISWEASASQVLVKTASEQIEAGHLIITAGAWLPVLAAELLLPLVVERQVQTWFAPQSPDLFRAGFFPVFIHFVQDRAYYGIPIESGGALKIARHHGGVLTTADAVSREITLQDEEDVRGYLRRYLPGADGPLQDAKVCLYTNSPDDHFIIDRHPSKPHVIIAGGFSGHGFKFAPVVGELVRDLVLGVKPQFDIGLFSIARLLS